MEETMMDSATVAEQEVTTTEPESTEVAENQPKDYWSEEFDAQAEPEIESDKDEQPKDAEEDKTTDVDNLEYVTSGLGELDKPIVIKYKGNLYDIKDKDQMRDLMERGMGATKKLQELAEMRKELEKQKNPEISEQELDNLDVTTEVEAISQKILESNYAEDFKGIVSKLPTDIVERMRKDPKMLEGLRIDTESGLAQKIMSKAQRYMDIDGIGFVEAYKRGGQELMSKQKDVSSRKTKLVSEPRPSNNIEVKEKSIWDIDDEGV